MASTKTQLTTISLGTMDLKISVVTFGRGPKIIGMVLGLHGVETTGLYLLQKLLARSRELKNKILAIPCANPSGIILASRFGGLDLPMDVKDPNRSFPGDKTGSVQDRVSLKLLEIVSRCDFVLDIHNYSNLGGWFPLLSLEGSEKELGENRSDFESLAFLKALQAEFAFFVDKKQAQQRGFVGTLNQTLNQRAVPNLCLEMPSIEFFPRSNLESLVERLIEAVNGVGKYKEKSLREQLLPRLVNTKIVRSEQAGIFFPAFRPPKEVQEGELIGEIFSPFTLKTSQIKISQKGLLVVIKRKNYVRVGEFLYEIGWEVKPLVNRQLKN